MATHAAPSAPPVDSRSGPIATAISAVVHRRSWPSRSAVFWILQLGGWVAYGCSKLLAFPMSAWDSVWVVAKGITITCLLRELFRALERHRMPFPVTIAAAIVTSILAAKATLELSYWASINHIALDAPGASRWLRSWEGLMYETMLLIAWSALYLGIGYALDLHREKVRLREALADAHSARARMLRYQLNPHFLFNALASLRASVAADPARAQQMITDLSGFLRYSLLADDVGLIPLQREFEVVRRYLAIQKVRFEERIEFCVELAPQLDDLELPAFLIQPLVENAVKYGMRSSTGTTVVQVTGRGSRDGCTLEVSNTGHWINAAPRNVTLDGAGIGLANLRQRLHEHFPDRHHLSIREDDGWVHVVLQLHGSR